MSKYVAMRDVGDTILDLLCDASSVGVGNMAYRVLGYDPTDDVLCLENFTGDDITVYNASTKISCSQIMVEVRVKELLLEDLTGDT